MMLMSKRLNVVSVCTSNLCELKTQASDCSECSVSGSVCNLGSMSMRDTITIMVIPGTQLRSPTHLLFKLSVYE